MFRLIGYVPMKEKEGLVLHCVKIDKPFARGAGYPVENLFVYDELVKKFDSKKINSDFDVVWTRSITGRASVADVIFN